MRLESVHGYGRGRPARSVVPVTEDLAQPSTSTSAAKWLGIALATIVGIPVLLVLAVLVTYGVQRATPEDYPKAAPQTMADRAGARSQEAYDVLGFDATLPGGEFNSLSAGYCYPDGLESAADESVDGAYALSHQWHLTDVPESEALPAMRRLRDHLKTEGWDIVSFDSTPSGDNWTLRTERDGDGRQVYEWYADGGRFYGGVHAECAYDRAQAKDPYASPDDATAGLTAATLRPVTR
ncbi:hypothetical protein SPRI_4315 [Streptomyces pristinaespiralis]|uniref:Uncharacterized protein n=1 Tax=Streptomyces pristinaespiralis TaxID=38300 RepID=A0A0M4DCC3_STRPR|nr:hypothetical protein SPRI_4315 [Streptomyces pristinaespiralis]